MATDYKTYLMGLGYTEETAAKYAADPDWQKVVETGLKQYQEGQSALAEAQRQQKETETYWASKTTDLAKIEETQKQLRDKAAAAEARLAARTAWLQNLKTQGYDIPDEIIGTAATPPGVSPTETTPRAADTGQFLTRDEWDKRARAIAPDLVTLTALSNEYQYLNGKPYTEINADFAEAQKQGKPLTDYVRAKYNFEAKHAEKEKAAAEASYRERFEKDLAVERAKWAEQNGPNPNTRIPLSSSFDKLASQPGFDAKSWANPDARKAHRQERLEKFKNTQFKTAVQ